MSVQQIAEKADMIVSGYAYIAKEDYVEVIDLNSPEKKAVIQNGEIVESVMDDTQDDIVLEYYSRNRSLLEESINA